MRGWVYVMSNRSMPGLVKVGFSSKDPDLRAKELDHTGTPHPYVVDYEALVQDPYQVEQRAHKSLVQFSEGKEWFRCSVDQAIYALKKSTVGEMLHESFRKGDRDAIEARVNTEKRKLDEARAKEERERTARAKLDAEVERVRAKYQTQLDSMIIDRGFLIYWFVGAIIMLFGIGIFNPKMKDGPALFLVGFVGAVIGAFIKSGSSDRQKKKRSYVDLKKRMESEIQQVLTPTTKCRNYGKEWQFDAYKAAISKPSTGWLCAACKSPLAI